MGLRSSVLFSMMLAFGGLVPACADEGEYSEVEQEEVLIESEQQSLTIDQVNCRAAAWPTQVAAGKRVTITANLTPTTSAYYQVKALITRPDGSSFELKNFGRKYLTKSVTTMYQAALSLEAGAAAGAYSVSLVVARDGATAQRGDRLASFRVTGGQATPPPPPPPAPQPVPTPPPAPTPAPIPQASKGLSISGRHILDGTGKRFTARGPELVTASIEQLAQIDAIAATGANSMRMLLTLDTANGMTPALFDQLVGRAVERKMVVWVSLFTWDNSRNREIAAALGGGQLRAMDDYLTVWKRQWLKDLIKKYDGWVVIDAMQEFLNTISPRESPAAVREWVEAAKKHIVFFRQQGYTQPLEIMSSFEGRDLHAIIANADEMLAADTLSKNGSKQTMFGWQAYWGTSFYQQWQGQALVGRSMTAAEAVKQFVATRNYPIMVGLDTIDIPGTESYGTLMPLCSGESVGWLWWEWNELVSGSHGQTVRNSREGFAGSVKTSQAR